MEIFISGKFRHDCRVFLFLNGHSTEKIMKRQLAGYQPFKIYVYKEKDIMCLHNTCYIQMRRIFLEQNNNVTIEICRSLEM